MQNAASKGSSNGLHAEFERRETEAHYSFLLSLGISENEALHIRAWSADIGNVNDTY